MNYSKNPSSFARLIQCGQESIGTAAEDLATFIDMTPYEYILVVATCSVIGTSTNLTVKFVSSAASAGTSPVTAKDTAATPADLSATLAGAGIADGNTLLFQVRTRGLLQWGSPQFTAATAAMGVAYSIIGIGVRDTAELAAGWIDESSSVVVEAGSFAP